MPGVKYAPDRRQLDHEERAAGAVRVIACLAPKNGEARIDGEGFLALRGR